MKKLEITILTLIALPFIALMLSIKIGNMIVDYRFNQHNNYIIELNEKGYSLEEIDKWLKNPYNPKKLDDGL